MTSLLARHKGDHYALRKGVHRDRFRSAVLICTIAVGAPVQPPLPRPTVLPIGAAGLASTVQQSEGNPLARPGQQASAVFSEAQAARGKALYEVHCRECHGRKLEGETAAPLAGQAFMRDWGKGKRTVDDLYYIVRTTMPYTAGNTLEKQQYVDIITYILQVNGYPVGEGELMPDPTVLGEIIIRPQAAQEDGQGAP